MKNMLKQPFELNNEREQLVEQMHKCEQMLSDCTIDRFSELRHELKQVKEKLRFLNQFSRMS